MDKAITYENLRNFTYSNDKLIRGNIKGIVLEFTGLGFQDMLSEAGEAERRYAQQGIVYLRPYYNPWSWMNRQTVAFTDTIVDRLMEAYQLPESTPIVASGGSMGGLCALVYTYYAKRTPIACVTNCPVCDLVYHYTERPDTPRTLYSAFGAYDMPLDEALRSASPVHLAEKMPRISYRIFHCNRDEMVNMDAHSCAFLQAMAGHDISLYEVADRGHCDLPEAVREKYDKCILDAFAKV